MCVLDVVLFSFHVPIVMFLKESSEELIFYCKFAVSKKPLNPLSVADFSHFVFNNSSSINNEKKYTYSGFIIF